MSIRPDATLRWRRQVLAGIECINAMLFLIAVILWVKL